MSTVAYYNKYLLLNRDKKLRNVKPRKKRHKISFICLILISFLVQLVYHAAKQDENIIKTWSLEQARLNVDSTTYLRPQAVLFGCLFFHKVSASFLTEYILVLFTNDVETNAVVVCLFVFI